MPNLTCTSSVNIPDLYRGSLYLLPSNLKSEELCDFATSIIEDVFESSIKNISTSDETSIEGFVLKAKKCKSIFSNHDKTKNLLRSLILERYRLHSRHNFLFDVPRLRIVPRSSFLSSGISYNYKAHRDSWYGGGQDQLNHWIALSNVTENSTFYIAPSYFSRPIKNNSETFDLDEWDTKYRPLAEQNTKEENRPHPVPLEDIPLADNWNVVIPRASEIVFSGHHLHGSVPNTTEIVRFSIDYRVCLVDQAYEPPENLDNKSTGNYRKYMFPVN